MRMLGNVNTALIELRKHGGGPVHINLTTKYSTDFSIDTLLDERVIKYYTYNDKMPEINFGRVGIFVGSHLKLDKRAYTETTEGGS